MNKLPLETNNVKVIEIKGVTNFWWWMHYALPMAIGCSCERDAAIGTYIFSQFQTRFEEEVGAIIELFGGKWEEREKGEQQEHVSARSSSRLPLPWLIPYENVSCRLFERALDRGSHYNITQCNKSEQHKLQAKTRRICNGMVGDCY